MGAIYTGIETGNPIINGIEHYGFYNGVEVFGSDRAGLYIAEGNTSNRQVQIYNNNNGNKGNLVRTINANDWTTLSQYAPEIEKMLNYICYQCTGVGVDLNFVKCKTTGIQCFFSCLTFNSNLYFPSLIEFGSDSTYELNAFNKNINFPKLEIVHQNFMAWWRAFRSSITTPSLKNKRVLIID